MVRGIFLAVLGGVVVLGLSWWFTSLWSTPREERAALDALVIQEGMTVGAFVRENEVPEAVVRRALGVTDASESETRLGELGLAEVEIRRQVERAWAIYVEHGSKNWVKIRLKFALWFVILITAFVLMRTRRATLPVRFAMLVLSAAVFGVVLGADPNPMGTIKDAVVLYGEHGVIFPPRLIAMFVFLALVVLANKFICAWGCQLGTLQDALFQAGRRNEGRRSRWPQIRPPFVLTNTVRTVFFTVMVVGAVAFGFDIVGAVDAFKVFHPQVIGVAAAVMISVVLLVSPFWYRPWCHLFCPFGLLGWLFEKVSLFHVRVDYDKCISCLRCERSCPSTVMSAILRRDKKTVPDCFACSTCIQQCPTQAISLTTARRTRPPEGKFPPRKNAGVSDAPSEQ